MFFEKDAVTKTGTSEPNWFYYWSQSPIIQNLLTIDGITMYDMNTCDFETTPTSITLSLKYKGMPYNPNPGGNSEYGYLKFNPGAFETRNPTQVGCGGISQRVAIGYYPSLIEIGIGEACGFAKVNAAGTNDEGIHVLYRTVVHEVEHANIECETWNYVHPSQPTVKSGYSNLWDVDGDGYKDVWEQHIPGAAYDFEISDDPALIDTYSGNYAGAGSSDCYTLQTCSAGTMYEEDRCRHEETTLNLADIDMYDWSFDHSNVIQGKQWH